MHRDSGRRIGQEVLERRLTFDLRAEFGHRDITSEVESVVTDAGIELGLTVVQLVGSTGAITTIEYETGALDDLRRALDIIAPTDGHYEHNARWGDGNGFSHVRSALLKTSIAVPIVSGHLSLGTWQQIIVLNLDNRPRSREIVVLVLGSG